MRGECARRLVWPHLPELVGIAVVLIRRNRRAANSFPLRVTLVDSVTNLALSISNLLAKNLLRNSERLRIHATAGHPAKDLVVARRVSNDVACKRIRTVLESWPLPHCFS